MEHLVVKELEKALGSSKVHSDEARLDERRRDYSVLSKLDDMQGRGAPRPMCVVSPSCTDDVVKVVNICRQNGTKIIPFGLGSGVCCGIIASPDAVVLDMGSMNKVRKIDTQNMLATFEAGVIGADAENAVLEHDLIIGHYPQSIDVSSVGGWVATRAAGQFSTAYGNIENMVKGLEVVLPNGEVITMPAVPRSATGPELREIFIGSEGTLGVITEVTFALHRKPEEQAYTAFYVPTMEQGFEIQRLIVQSGWTPPVMRQYDPSEVQRLFPDHVHGEDILIIMVHEGPKAKVELEVRECNSIVEKIGGEEAPIAAVTEWLDHRNSVPSVESFLEQGTIVDTVEIAAGWDQIGSIFDNAVASLNEVENMLIASAHSSHCYRTGLNLYFSFAARPDDSDRMSDVYSDCWRRIMEATINGGGTISHHHGIGRVRKKWMSAGIGESSVDLLRCLKAAIDPENMMNPSVLIPD